MKTFNILSVIVSMTIFSFTDAGPFSALASYGICQTGCNALVVSCYAAAGLVFGTVTAGAGIPAAAIGCNIGLGTCMAGCASVTLAAAVTPTP